MSYINDFADVPHRKKKQQTSKSSHRSDHKHEYEKIILESFVGWCWGKRCVVCGRVDGKMHLFYNKDFIKPECVGLRYLSKDMFYSVKELKEKYNGVPIYKMADRVPDGAWEYIPVDE